MPHQYSLAPVSIYMIHYITKPCEGATLVFLGTCLHLYDSWYNKVHVIIPWQLFTSVWFTIIKDCESATSVFLDTCQHLYDSLYNKALWGCHISIPWHLSASIWFTIKQRPVRVPHQYSLTPVSIYMIHYITKPCEGATSVFLGTCQHLYDSL